VHGKGCMWCWCQGLAGIASLTAVLELPCVAVLCCSQRHGNRMRMVRCTCRGHPDLNSIHAVFFCGEKGCVMTEEESVV
jgi:hypothetical protein